MRRAQWKLNQNNSKPFPFRPSPLFFVIPPILHIIPIVNIARVETLTTVSRKSQRLQALTSINATDANSMQSTNNNSQPNVLNGTATPTRAAVNHRGYSRIPVLNKKCADNETDSHACHLFETCASSLLLLLEEVEYKLTRSSSSDLKSHCGGPQSLDDIINVRTAFYGGFILGSIIGVIILYVLKQLCVCMFISICGTKDQKQSKLVCHILKTKNKKTNKIDL